MIIKMVKTEDDIENAFKIRKCVFIEEQKIPENIEIDQFEKQSDHFLILDDKNPIGTARVRYLDNKTAKIERMAILKENRNKGAGSVLFKYILEFLKEKEISIVTINAQLHARDFYCKFDFNQVGDVFEEAGIKHIKMEREL